MISLNDYARAYVQCASADHDMIRHVDALADVIQRTPPLKSFLGDASVTVAVKRQALTVALPSASDAVVNLITMIASADALEQLEALPTAVREAAAAHAHLRYARVRSAVPLTPRDEERIKTLLKKRFQADMELEQTTDPALLAGFLVSVGDWTLDASLKGKMDRLQNALLSPTLATRNP
jgi:F-type H+-transporting ATPase subunit delta